MRKRAGYHSMSIRCSITFITGYAAFYIKLLTVFQIINFSISRTFLVSFIKIVLCFCYSSIVTFSVAIYRIAVFLTLKNISACFQIFNDRFGICLFCICVIIVFSFSICVVNRFRIGGLIVVVCFRFSRLVVVRFRVSRIGGVVISRICGFRGGVSAVGTAVRTICRFSAILTEIEVAAFFRIPFIIAANKDLCSVCGTGFRKQS